MTKVNGLLCGQRERVGDSSPTRCGGHRRLPPFPAGVGDRDEVAAQIAAVDGGNVLGLEDPEIAGVVPIEEVAAETRHTDHRRQRRLQALDGLARADPTEVAGADDGQQIQSEVGRRSAMGHLRRRVFLKIVGRQPIVRRADEDLEEPPRAARRSPEG